MKAKRRKERTTRTKHFEREQFVAWLALPAKERKPKTQGEFAAEFKVNEATLSQWKNDPEFLQAVRKRIDKRLVAHHPDVMHGLLKKAKAGEPGAVKLWLQYVYDWAEKHREEHTVVERLAPSLELLADEQLDDLIVRTAKEITAKRKAAGHEED